MQVKPTPPLAVHRCWRSSVAWLLTAQAYPFITVVVALILSFELFYSIVFRSIDYLYFEFLANYDLGFLKRALVPHLVSLVWPKVSHAEMRFVFALVILSAVATYLAAFFRQFGKARASLPILSFVLGSPFFFKNYIYDFGRLDIFGCVGATLALLIPVNWLYLPALCVVSSVLILVHEVQAVTYVPLIAAIGILRSHCERKLSWTVTALAAPFGLLVLFTFFWVMQFGNARVPESVLLDHFRARALDASMEHAWIWYAGIAQQAIGAWDERFLWGQFVSLPKYFYLAFIHWPLGFYLVKLVANVEDPRTHFGVIMGLSIISLFYVVMLTISWDRARLFANWGTSLLLATHAIALLGHGTKNDTNVFQSRAAVMTAWLLALTPRVGVIVPFSF
jgi:hypothetical protein